MRTSGDGGAPGARRAQAEVDAAGVLDRMWAAARAIEDGDESSGSRDEDDGEGSAAGSDGGVGDGGAAERAESRGACWPKPRGLGGGRPRGVRRAGIGQ